MIRLENVCIRPRWAAQPVLNNLTLSVPQGHFRWLLGPSGAGKSSLLKLLALMHRSTSGQLNILGTSVTTAHRSTLTHLRRKIGFIPQDYHLIGNWSVFDNVALPLRLQNTRATDIKSETRSVLDWLGIAHLERTSPRDLSGGEQQRVAIARALITRPALLLADEPTNAQEESQARRLLQTFHQLVEMGTTVIVATHNETLVREAPAPAIILRNGTLDRIPSL